MTDPVSISSSLRIPVSRADLVTILRKVQWTSATALEQARARVVGRLDDAWEECVRCAERLSQPLDRIVRNVVAEAPAEEVPFWRLVLLARVLDHAENGQESLVEALSEVPADWALAESIVKGADEIPDEQYGAFFGPEDHAVAACLIAAARRRAHPNLPPAGELLRLALGDLPPVPGVRPALLRERLRLLDRTFATLPRTLRASADDVRSLPPAVRQVLLSRPGLVTRIGGRALERAVRGDPKLTRDAVLGLQRTGLEALRKRRFLDDGLVALARKHPDTIPIDEKLLEDALRRGARRTEPGPDVAKHLARLVRLSPPRLRSALAVLLEPPGRQPRLLAKLPPADLATCLTVLPEADCPCDRRAADFFLSAKLPRGEWDRKKAAEASLEALSRYPALALLGGLEKSLRSTPPSPLALDALGSPGRLRTIGTKAGPEGRRLVGLLASKVREDPTVAAAALRPLLVALPALGLRAVPPSLPDSGLLGAVGDEKIEAPVRSRLLSRFCRGKTGEALLGRLLSADRKRAARSRKAAGSAESGPAPKPFSPILLAEAGRSLPRLARLFPSHREALLPLAVEKLPLRALLPSALEDLGVARAVEKKHSRAQLGAEIPWVRRKFRETPYLAAAYELALAFGLTRAGQLRGLAAKAAAAAGGPRGSALDDLYRCYELPKKSGGNRTVTVPADALKSLQRRLLRSGFAEVPLHESATGFRPGLSIRDNALPHVGKPLVVNVDIASFFPSTRYELVLRACRKLLGGKISPAAARLAADLCCFGGALPTGAPTSPAIANIVLTPLDKALGKVCARHGISYTRYADDLTFSGGSDAKKVLPFVHRLLDQLGYRLDGKKTNLFRRGRRQVVTGLVVNDKPNLPRRLRRKLRAAVDQRARGGQAKWHGKFIGDAKLLGLIAHLNLVQPEEARRHKQRLEAVRTKKALS